MQSFGQEHAAVYKAFLCIIEPNVKNWTFQWVSYHIVEQDDSDGSVPILQFRDIRSPIMVGFAPLSAMSSFGA